MRRTNEHVQETKSRDIIRQKVNSYYPKGDALIREWSERDYGIDFILELFEDGMPTGKIAFLQVKGTGKLIEKNKKSDDVSCSISTSCLDYALQSRIPFVLIYVSMIKPVTAYYVDLQSVVDKTLYQKKSRQKKMTVRIPFENHFEEDLSGMFKIINHYFDAIGKSKH